jgi:hypothetical protein
MTTFKNSCTGIFFKKIQLKKTITVSFKDVFRRLWLYFTGNRTVTTVNFS